MKSSLAIRTVGLLLVVGALVNPPGASAAVIKYFGVDANKTIPTNASAARNAMVATLVTFGVDDLESFASGTPDPTLAFVPTSITATTDTREIQSSPVFAFSDNNFLQDNHTDTPGDPPVDDIFTLSQLVTGFGFFAVNAGDGDANTVTFRLTNTGLGTFKDVTFDPVGPGASQIGVAFFGVTDTDPFDQVTLKESNDYDSLLIDDVTAGLLVPEPASIVLLGVGLFAVGAIARRRRFSSRTNL